VASLAITGSSHSQTLYAAQYFTMRNEENCLQASTSDWPAPYGSLAVVLRLDICQKKRPVIKELESPRDRTATTKQSAETL
jgi:hypothetical protein